MPHRNPALWQARIKKAGAIARTLADVAFAAGVGPKSPRMVRWVLALSDEQWRAAAICAGQLPASEETRQVVIRYFDRLSGEERRARARVAALMATECDHCGVAVPAPVRCGTADEEVLLCGGCAEGAAA